MCPLFSSSSRRPPSQGYTCRRPPLSACSEAQFYDDLCEFLTLLRGKTVERSKFPEAVREGGVAGLLVRS